MTVSEARRTLSKPMKFGDPAQVSAIKFLQNVFAAKIAAALCEHERCAACGGTGKQLLHSPCECCGGDGTVLACKCFAGIDGEAVVEARKQLAGRRV